MITSKMITSTKNGAKTGKAMASGLLAGENASPPGQRDNRPDERRQEAQMSDPGKDVAVRAISEREKRERAMSDTQVQIRTVSPSDGEGLRRMFSRASSETIYRRFHIPFPEVPEWMVALMLDADHLNKEALVAVAEEKVVGHAMYARLGEGTEAEMAIVVEDEWQSEGVGKSLLLELASRARLRGLQTFTAEVL